MPSGQLEQRSAGPTVVGGSAAAEGVVSYDAHGEPPLSELLNDPITHLLWRADRLEPAEARAMLRAFQVKLRQLRRSERPARSRQGASARARHDLAA
jgi:hypothetical protein